MSRLLKKLVIIIAAADFSAVDLRASETQLVVGKDLYLTGSRLLAQALTKEDIKQRREWAEKKLGIKERKPQFYKDIESMQKFRSISSRVYSRTNDILNVKLVNLNKKVNRWYTVVIKSSQNGANVTMHLDNPFPKSQRFFLNPRYADGIMIEQDGVTKKCPLWDTANAAKLAKARAKPNMPYIAMCDFSVYVRMKIEGYRTTKEWIVEFLRDKVWGGESITNFVKEKIFQDKFMVKSQRKGQLSSVHKPADELLSPARIAPAFEDQLVELGELGIELKNKRLTSLKYGHWYETNAQDDVYVSIINPAVISSDVMDSYKAKAPKLDDVESEAINYLVAFDLEKFDLNYALGTDHPRLGWSKRSREELRGNKFGPDGFDTDAPLVRTGLIPPIEAKHIAATFTAGFKRSHSAFKWGPLGQLNQGSHYGFAEKGVFFSTPQPGLATIIVYNDGQVVLKTWEESDYKDYDKILHLRQNGVPITVWDEEKSRPMPGDFVSKWGEGNWSGSQERKFRSLRAGVCQIRTEDKNFLVYGYFSSATPAAMARVFQAYGCRYSLHLDMNALEHTYLALYDENKKVSLKPQHLVKPMEVLDQRFKGNVPRFIGYPDNRDFFYITPKK